MYLGRDKKIARVVQTNRRRDDLYTTTFFGEALWIIEWFNV